MTQKRRRNSLRKSGWDYRAAGYYFVTICTYQREHLFDSAEFKHIAELLLNLLPQQNSAATIELDEWIVMPNHIHLIVVILEGNSAEPHLSHKLTSGSISQLINTYKGRLTSRINSVRKTKGAPVWQRNYYDRIIRSEKELNNTRNYIRNNPIRWAEDRENLDRLISNMNCRKG